MAGACLLVVIQAVLGWQILHQWVVLLLIGVATICSGAVLDKATAHATNARRGFMLGLPMGVLIVTAFLLAAPSSSHIW